MDLFSKAKDSLALAGKELTSKANDVSGMARVSIKLKEEEKKMQENIYALGEQFCQNYTDEAMKLFPELMNEIKRSQKEILEAKKEMAVYRGMQICPNCGSEQDKDVLYCTACGINIEEASRMEVLMKVVSYCKTCGKELGEDSKFCMNCGTKVE